MKADDSGEVYTNSGTLCPADPRAKKSEHKNHNNWKYSNGVDFIEGEFDLSDNCHPKEH